MTRMWNAIYHGMLVRAKAWGAIATVRKTTQVTLETRQVQIIRRLRSSRRWCTECARDVDMVGLEEASALTEMTQAELLQWVGSGSWHFSRSLEGAQLICLDSLMKSLPSGK
jgi:hypothetical protein